MPRACSVCTHPQRAAIDQALVSGEPVTAVAARYCTKRGQPLGRMAVQRHKDEHLPATLSQAQQAAEVAQADSLLDQLRALQDKALSILHLAEEAGELRTAIAAIAQARGNLELLAKLLGELDERPQVNITLSSEWLTVRSVLLDALGPFPDARAAVASRLVGLETGQVPGAMGTVGAPR